MRFQSDDEEIDTRIEQKKQLFPSCKRTYTNKNKDAHINCFDETKIISTYIPFKFNSIGKTMPYSYPALNVNIHWGQRKLHLSEMLFLYKCHKLYKPEDGTEYNKKVFIYAGAAAGHHIVLLSLMFPDIHFMLYDPAPFAIKETDKIKIFNQYFTQDTAKELSKYKNALFCSDIRRLPQDEIIKEDMQWQSDWVKEIQPHASFLKFRVPWPKKTDLNKSTPYKYLEGDIYMQQWAPVKSTELRLLSIKEKTQYRDTIYDTILIEQTCFYFNNVIRQKHYYKHGYKCLNNHYDGMAEIRLWEKYLESKKIKVTNDIVCNLINLLTECVFNPNYSKIKEKYNNIIK